MTKVILKLCGVGKIQRILLGRHPVAILSALIACTSPALAEVCDKARPSWDGQPVSTFQEAIFLFSTFPSLILLVATAAALRFRSQWGGLAVVVLWTMLITVFTATDPTGTGEFALSEGCVGSPALFIVAVAAICVGTVLYTLPRKTRL